ncbi:MAG: DoxX family protein [Sphingobacteriales bacterium]|jgi:putative oxidoreductase|nr:DoxX family protein [Sphingobacteriales bacterium]
MKNLNDISLLVLRVSMSALMITQHGWRKFEKLLAGGKIEFYDFMGIGETPTLVLTVLGEVIAPAFILLGLFTRIAAAPAFITMAVAAFMVHAGDPFSDKEHALMYALVFLCVMLSGAGQYSLDHRLRKR